MNKLPFYILHTEKNTVQDVVINYIVLSRHSLECFIYGVFFVSHECLSYHRTSFVDLLWVFFVCCLLCLCACLFIHALWSTAGKGLTSWLSFVVSNCEFITFPSWARCGT